MPDWKSPTTLERLIAALIAANNGKVDNQAVARYMDETYDAVENRTRVYKKEGQKLVKEAEDAGRMEMDMRKRGSSSPRKPRSTPKKKGGDLNGVATGRVAKTPTKRKSTVKHETLSSDSSSVIDESQATTASAFGFDDMNFASFDNGGSFAADWNDGLA
ncbi:hypothetical protein AAFC00_002975 [Neodothiora populina]|uniref:Uncharacterized protein n=1 Tax=Neodothiora populina TaxID=2781224 RepID=A0ABR3P995_9PEZI